LIIEAPLVNAQNVQTGWMSAILDLSEQRRSEELSRASQERLQATARLAMAGEMASLISHELNQPLAAISSYASGSLNLIEDPAQPLTPDLRQDIAGALRRVAEQAERAGRVIKSVGDLVRRREREREAVSVNSLFDAISPLLMLQSRKLGIQVDIEIAPSCPPVWCDRTMIEQVLLNLARNGMQAMSEGDPPVASGLRRLSLRAALVPGQDGAAARRWVAFSVTDHGHGLSQEAMDRIFTPFFTTKAEGMGLGLNMCRTVVEQHGGALRFEPARPRGTVFHFTLPAASL
jgi:two-component system sensor histidine kinase DctS